MFDSLRSAFQGVAKSLGERELAEKDVDEALLGLEASLLDSDVALEVVDGLKSDLKERLVGASVGRRDVEAFVRGSLVEFVSMLLDGAGSVDLPGGISRKKGGGRRRRQARPVRGGVRRHQRDREDHQPGEGGAHAAAREVLRGAGRGRHVPRRGDRADQGARGQARPEAHSAELRRGSGRRGAGRRPVREIAQDGLRAGRHGRQDADQQEPHGADVQDRVGRPPRPHDIRGRLAGRERHGQPGARVPRARPVQRLHTDQDRRGRQGGERRSPW